MRARVGVALVCLAGLAPAAGAEPMWVRFRDRIAGAAPVAVSARAWARRAKVGIEPGALAVDLPVSAAYVRRLEALGLKIRARSRWLNAVSVELDQRAAAQVAELPFVLELRPVGRRAAPPQRERARARSIGAARGADEAEWGAIGPFFKQLGITTLQQRGLRGVGVMILVLDSGFRVSHQVFGGLQLADAYDFVFDDPVVQNEPEDDPSAHDHGTSVLSVLAADLPFTMVGAAPDAAYLLAKTEDVRSETPVEEDYWVEALEWGEALGIDIASSSVGYVDWYTAEQLDGQHALSSIAANQAAALGVLVVNSVGNRGFDPKPILAPADAPGTLSVGAVDLSAVITYFSSRGPTVDGRIKPELCAIGWDVPVASGADDAAYGLAAGTSFATPMVAGAAALLLEAHPDWTPAMVVQALRDSADHADFPDSHYGWGVIEAARAVEVGPRPVLELRSAIVSEPDNGALDPDESATLVIELANTGGLAAQALQVRPLIGTDTVPMPFPDIDPGAKVAGSAGTVTAAPDAVCGTALSGDLEVVGDDGLAARLPLALRVGWTLDHPAALADDFEVDSGLWNPTAGPGPIHWQRYDNPSFAHGGRFSYFAPATDFVNEAILESTDLSLPATPLVLLEFWQAFQMEATFDGGVIELAVDGGPWTDAAARILEHGYLARLDGRFGNPLGGRPSWSGNTLPDYQRVRLDLSDLAGRLVRLRFRAGHDAGIDWVGWFVDDLRILIGVHDCGGAGMLALSPGAGGAAELQRRRRGAD